jgi:cyclopropane-fatty-acyl-phospholipid synthase
VKVKAYNVSHAQVEWAKQRAQSEGLSDRVEFIEDDYRNMDGQCDVFVSIGMVEHVGARNYPILGRVIDKILPQHGRGLIHNIAQNQPVPTNPWAQKYIFPDGYSPTLREMMDIFEPNDFSIVDIENLRLHYAMTLEHWLQRFENNVDEVTEMFDDKFVRMWRLYLCASIANFTTGNLQLYQILFQRPDVSVLPLTRKHLYMDQIGSE